MLGWEDEYLHKKFTTSKVRQNRYEKNLWKYIAFDIEEAEL
jgi:ABC-type microcin C transport system permease subunit YejB